jgi:hypothetical protein
MHKLIKFLLAPYFRRYEAMKFRLSNLEIAVDYMIDSPKWMESDKTGFNGQRLRKLIFEELLKAVHFDAIIETGTWLGNTTGYMAKKSNLPVYTCELNRRFYSLARIRLEDIPNIIFSLDDSRSFLNTLAHTEISKKRILFYLDAHWYEDLPLQEELETICSGWKEFVIMIDDFQVPRDKGYGYDSYGKGKELSLGVFSGIISKLGLLSFFPATSSDQETGEKRGCIVLARRGDLSEVLRKVQLLREKDL